MAKATVLNSCSNCAQRLEIGDIYCSHCGKALEWPSVRPKALKIKNPLNGHLQRIQSVLRSLAGQEGCDGEPYDEMMAAADYIDELEGYPRN